MLLSILLQCLSTPWRAYTLFVSISPLHPVTQLVWQQQLQQRALVTRCQTLCYILYSCYLMRDSKISAIIALTLEMRTARLREVN